MAPEFTVIYNDPYGHDSNSPFSQFELTMGGSFGKGSGVGVNSTEQNILYSIDQLKLFLLKCSLRNNKKRTWFFYPLIQRLLLSKVGNLIWR